MRLLQNQKNTLICSSIPTPPFFLIIKIKIILRGINKTHVPVFLTVPYSKPLGLRSRKQELHVQFHVNLYLTRPQILQEIAEEHISICKRKYINKRHNTNTNRKNLFLDFNIGDTAAIAAAPHTPVPIPRKG